MLALTRDTKRLTFVVIYSFLFLGTGIGLYFLFRADPTCLDGKENQNETGIDCGGVCAQACLVESHGEPLQIREVSALPTVGGSYDVVATVTNPNSAVGAKEFRYTVRLVDGADQAVATAEGRSWVLPRETKTLIAFNLAPTQVPARAILEITDVSWANLADYDTEPKIGIYQPAYTPSGEPGELGGVATGLIVNESEYDFRLVTVKVVLRDSAGRPLAANQTDRRTFLVGDQHGFRLPWPTPFGGTVAEVSVEVDADVYSSDNFLKRFLPGAPTAPESIPKRGR